MDTTNWPIGGEVIDAVTEVVQGVRELAFELVVSSTSTMAATLPLFVLVLLVTWAGRRRLAPWAHCVLWTLVLIRMVLPISPICPFSAQIVWPLATHLIADEPLPTLTIEQALTAEKNVSTVVPSSRQALSLVDWLDWFSTTTFSSCIQALFVTATILVAIVTLVSFHRLIGWLRFGEKISDPAFLTLVEEGRRQFGIRASIRVLKIHELDHPAVFDWFCPWILLPETFSSLPTSHQRCALWHAMASIRRGDSVACLFVSIVRVFHWWNPLFWWSYREWQTERLLACDFQAIERLSPDDLQDYIQVHSIPRKPSRGNWLRLWMDPPGLVTSATCPSITSRRLAILNGARTREGRWRYWTSWCVIGILATVGLTDPPPVSLKDLPIQLPAGTTWEDAPADPEDGSECEQREYDIASCVSKLKSDDPDATEDTIAHLVRLFISLQHRERSPTAPEDASRSVWVDDQKLVVRTTAGLHGRIARLIQDWELHSRRQVIVEARSFSTEIELRDLLLSPGGILVNSLIDPEILSNQTGPVKIVTNSIVQRPQPTFVRVLQKSECVEFLNRVKGGNRIFCGRFAPSVLAIEGKTAKTFIGGSAQIVTGFHRERSGFNTPRMSSPYDGVGMEFIAMTESDRTHLRIAFHHTSVDTSFQQKLKSPTMDTIVHVPLIRSEVTMANVTFGPDESLLLVPLVRFDSGELPLYLITPQVFEPAEESEVLLSLPRQ